MHHIVIEIHIQHKFHEIQLCNYLVMTPDGQMDGRTEGQMDGHGQNYMPPPSAGDNITNLRFADDSDALAEEQELKSLVESLDQTCTRIKMYIKAEKTKLITNIANGIKREITVKRQKLGTVTSFKYPWSKCFR